MKEVHVYDNSGAFVAAVWIQGENPKEIVWGEHSFQRTFIWKDSHESDGKSFSPGYFEKV